MTEDQDMGWNGHPGAAPDHWASHGVTGAHNE